MILLLNTSTGRCDIIVYDDGSEVSRDEWQADRTLADGLLARLEHNFSEAGMSWKDLAGIGIFEGPGSFTGLRIGMSVANTAADSLGIPIVGARGDDWEAVALERLARGENDEVVLPAYGQAPHITTPRK